MTSLSDSIRATQHRQQISSRSKQVTKVPPPETPKATKPVRLLNSVVREAKQPEHLTSTDRPQAISASAVMVNRPHRIDRNR